MVITTTVMQTGMFNCHFYVFQLHTTHKHSSQITHVNSFVECQHVHFAHASPPLASAQLNSDRQLLHHT